MQNKVSPPHPQPEICHTPRLSDYVRDGFGAPHRSPRPSAPHRPRSSALMTVQFADRSKAMSIFRDAMCGDPSALSLTRAIATVIRRIADRRFPKTLCACCAHEFDRDELPGFFAIATTDERVIASGVCVACSQLPFDEMKGLFMGHLRGDTKDDALRELPAAHFIDGSEIPQ